MRLDIDWPLAIELAAAFVILSYVRWRWFRSRMRRLNKKDGDKK
jgi:hypothetical protein